MEEGAFLDAVQGNHFHLFKVLIQLCPKFASLLVEVEGEREERVEEERWKKKKAFVYKMSNDKVSSSFLFTHLDYPSFQKVKTTVTLFFLTARAIRLFLNSQKIDRSSLQRLPLSLQQIF